MAFLTSSHVRPNNTASLRTHFEQQGLVRRNFFIIKRRNQRHKCSNWCGHNLTDLINWKKKPLKFTKHQNLQEMVGDQDAGTSCQYGAGQGCGRRLLRRQAYKERASERTDGEEIWGPCLEGEADGRSSLGSLISVHRACECRASNRSKVCP